MVPGGGNKRRQTDVVQLTANHSYRSGKIELAEFRRSISFDLFENTGKMITRGKSAFTGNFRNASVGIAKQNRRLQNPLLPQIPLGSNSCFQAEKTDE